MKNTKSILLISHYTETQGMVHKFFDFLKNTYNIGLLLHPLFPSSALKSTYAFGTHKKEIKFPAFMQYMSEVILNFLFVTPTLKKKFDLIICFDPLSFLNIFFYKMLINRKVVLVYYNLDYSKQRFASSVMNGMYQSINRFAFRTANYFISPTSQMMHDLDPEKKLEKKCFVLPHTVAIKHINKRQQKFPDSFIFAGTLGYSVDFQPLLLACSRLEKEKIAYRLDIYGGGSAKEKIISEMKRLHIKSIIFYDPVDNSVLVNEILPRYQISIAPYITKKKKGIPDHMFHGIDLTSKIVEYIAAGLPVISTRLYQAFDMLEQKKFGILVASSDDWYHAMKTFLRENTFYKTYKKNAEKTAIVYDVEKNVTPLIQTWLQTIR